MDRPGHSSTDPRRDPDGSAPQKSADAYRTIGEVADDLKLPQHVLRFWETRFPQVKPLKRAGGRRFYRPEDVAMLRAVQALLYGEGYTIKGVQRLFQEFGARHVAEALARSAGSLPEEEASAPSPGDHHRTAIAMAKDEAVGRRDPGLALPRPAPPAGPVRPAAGVPPAAPPTAMIARLEGAIADLAECGRLLASLRSTRN